MRWLALTFLLAGCQASVVRIGRPYPPSTPDCALSFEWDDAQNEKLRTSYWPVGRIELPHVDGNTFQYTDSVKAKLRPDACKLGGDVVAYGGSYNVGGDPLGRKTNGSPWGRFGVYRKKTP